MVLKKVFAIVVAMLLAPGSLARADGSRPDAYRPDEFLGLDLSKAALSKKPLGPPSRFSPVQVEAKTDLGHEARPVHVERVTRSKARAAHLDNEKSRAVAHARLARSHRNLLNAQAFDARIQVWPCRSGGICSWRPSAN
ncbi:MAG TPA: hypothetical protein VN941_07715 [Bradyrhizobium sp.]|nr:hypothetical protein [Bradyrhizobium sp.]